MKFSRGAEIAEYGLILALLVLIAIPALVVMGEGLSASYFNMNPTGKAAQLFGLLGGGGGPGGGGSADGSASSPTGSEPAPAEAVAVASADAPAEAQPADSLFTGENTALSATMSELVSQGFKATSADGILQAVGANGGAKTTEALLGGLEELVDQMEASGEMTADEADHFRRLANQGHRIAAIERIIEQAGERYDGDYANDQQFMAQRVEYNGRTVTIGQLSTLIDLPGGTPTNWYDHLYTGHVNTSNDFFSPNELSSFVDIYQDSQKLEVVRKNPELYDYIYSMSSTVIMTGEQVGSLEFKTGNESAVRESLATSLSGKADQASANICTAGQNSSSGSSCQ